MKLKSNISFYNYNSETIKTLKEEISNEIIYRYGHKHIRIELNHYVIRITENKIELRKKSVWQVRENILEFVKL